MTSIPRRPIAVLVHDLSATGVVRNAIAIANRMRAEGWPVQLITHRAHGALAKTVSREVRIVELGKPGSRGRGTSLVFAIPRLARHLAALRPALVLSAGNHFHLPCALATRDLAGAKVVYRVSNDLSHARDGSARTSLRGLLLGWIALRADRLILVSRSLASRLDGPSTVIENGVDVAAVQAAATRVRPLDLDTTLPQVLAIGRLAAQKNLETLIGAVALANQTRPLGLTIVGAGSPAYRRKLEDLSDDLGIGDRFTLHGAIANPFPVMAQADVIALPSWWEGASNVLLEAMACGRPVVASHRAGNAADVLDGGRYGRLVDPADEAGLAAALLAQIGPGAIPPGDRAADYSLDRTLDRYVAVLEDVMTSSPRRPRAPKRLRLAAALSALLALFGGPARAEPAALVSAAKAVATAERQLSARAIDVELATRASRLVYEIELVRRERLHEVLVDARTGEIVGADQPRALGLYRQWFDRARVTPPKTVRPLGPLLTVIEQDQGHRVHEATFRVDEGRPVYEVEIDVGEAVVEAVYDAVSGERIGVGYEG